MREKGHNIKLALALFSQGEKKFIYIKVFPTAILENFYAS